MDQLKTQQLIEALEKLGDSITQVVSQKYTLTGAADWPILVIMVGVILMMVAFMWVDLKNTIKDNRGESRSELKEETDHIWTEIRRCQEKCQK